jgi:hypothetical protein
MVFEDAHWIDPTSRELLDLTAERVRSLPVLLIVTFRPEFQPPWTGRPQVTKLALNRLDRREQTFLVAQIADGKPLPDQVVAQIVDVMRHCPKIIENIRDGRVPGTDTKWYGLSDDPGLGYRTICTELRFSRRIRSNAETAPTLTYASRISYTTWNTTNNHATGCSSQTGTGKG